MIYNGIKFKSVKEFRTLQDVASAKGIETIGEFNKFVKQYSNTKNK